MQRNWTTATTHATIKAVSGVTQFVEQNAATLTQLRTLTIDGNNVTPVDLIPLNPYTNIRSLSFISVPRVCNQLYFWSKQLTSLSFHDADLSTETLRILLGPNNSLLSLSLYGRMRWNDSSLKPLEENTRLTSLSLDAALSLQNLIDLGLNTSIHTLTIHFAFLSLEAAEFLAKKLKVKTLQFYVGPHDTSESLLISLALNTNLTSLNLCGFNFKSSGLTALFGSATLCSLNLAGAELTNPLTPEEVNVLLGNQTLTSLQLSSSFQLPEDVLISLAGKTQYQSLKLNRYTKEIFKTLAMNTTLQSLNLLSDINEEDRIYSLDLFNNPSIENLIVCNRYLRSIEGFNSSIASNSSLRTLEFLDHPVGDKLDDNTLAALSTNTTLVHLSSSNIHRDKHYAHYIVTITDRLSKNQLHWGSVFYLNLHKIFAIAWLSKTSDKTQEFLLRLPSDLLNLIFQHLILSLNLPRQSANTLIEMARKVARPDQPGGRFAAKVYNDKTKQCLTFFNIDSAEKIRSIKEKNRTDKETKGWIPGTRSCS